MNNEIEEFFIIYVAYNEEKSLLPSFLSAKKSLNNYFSLNPKVKAHVLICPNGCTDKTLEVAEQIKNNYKSENIIIDIISSSKGMVIAQNKCLAYIRKNKKWNDCPLIFIDADSFIEERVITAVIGQLKKFPKLQAVGIQP